MDGHGDGDDTPRIVVGVDGSTGSRTALQWAVEEARAHDAVVEAVFIYPYVHVGLLLEEPALIPGRVHEEAREAAERHLENSIDAAGIDETVIDLRRRVVEGRPADRLLAAAHGADLLVLGSRGLGGFRGLLLGSVSNQCIQHARCPIVVIPETVTFEKGHAAAS